MASSEHIFGVRSGILSRTERERRERAAVKHGATFIYAELHDGTRSWFVCRNLGEPFNRDTARAVMAELGRDIRVIDAHTPGQQRSACAYGPDWWAVLEQAGRLVAAPIGTMDQGGAQAEAVERGAVALVRFYHVAYNVAPSMQTRADWALEAASTALGKPYREGGAA